MPLIKAPENYINRAGIIREAAAYVKTYGSRALVVTSPSASKAASALFTGFESIGLHYEKLVFEGFPTFEKAERYALDALEKKADVLVAVGGGKVMDVTKTAGNLTGIPVVAVPTIAATCAAWAAVSILYRENGDFQQIYQNRQTPRLILADPEIIAAAPERYIKAGIIDTLAKYIEMRPGILGKENSLELQISFYGADLARQILEEKAPKALQQIRENRKTQKNVITEEITSTIDAIIFLAGFVGSFVGSRAFSGFAHPFYFVARRFPDALDILHGELVAYGLIAQLIMEKRTEQELENTLRLFDQYDQVFTLKDIHLSGQREEEPNHNLSSIAQRTLAEFPGFTKLGFGQSEKEIFDALLQTDRLCHDFIVKNKKGVNLNGSNREGSAASDQQI